MSNPFEAFKKERLAKEAALRQEEERRQQALKLAEAERAKKVAEQNRLNLDLHNQYNEMVLRILNALQDALYPSCQVSGSKDSPYWNIGAKDKYWESANGDNSGYEWDARVVVTINPEKAPYLFICSGNGKRIECQASESELIKTLTLLHEQNQ